MNGFPEEELRRALHALADSPAAPLAAPTPQAAVRAAARIRGRRRAAGAGLAAAVAVLAVLVPQWAPGDGARMPAPPAASAPPPSAQAEATEPADQGDPALGVPYPHALYVHCGIRYTKFGGRWWRAEPEVPEEALDAGLRTDAYTAGTMVLVSEVEARFVRRGPDLAVTFRPLAVEPPPCR
ncbi:hypothetical protein OHA37_21535 [Streptomyces sp. NBC_00335]|uniref:hypothetical protein n=1 Tax=unclassified Streptomyces TaxID=2593676 RepID=UPI002253C190|nr:MULTISPECIES: hypothetical protein [unclassified Streptomyces]MCX5406445.1 hypothetical protein [Streptomyces sp. NBC_00086]